DTKTRVTFEDVAGVEEVIEEVREIVDFLKNPKKYTKLGAKIPKGVLLVGPPGTGKTLLAKAVAGEANVPFFSLSGSDFVEMFVGVGASRVRDLFAEAKSKAPCIIFIDEIDAIGRSRAKGFVMGGHDERENTLNQLLVEMDGFNTDKGVIIMGATNRPDVLDSALLRPGRFDRQVVLDRPDLKARVDIFKVHTKGMPLAADLDVKSLAAQTPGFAGAEIANVCNEASLLASRKDKERIEMSDFQEAIERVIGGLEKKNKIISPRERVIVAYHESGHAVVGHYLENADPVHKVSIVPRGIGALGYTLQTPLEDRYLLSKDELIERMCSLLGGRAAEDIVLGKVSTGASNDLERVTEIANRMVTMYGMSDKLGNLSFTEQGRENFLGGVNMKPYSEETAKLIDSEVKSIVDMAYEKTKQLLIDRREELEALTQRLLEKEVLDKKQIEEILGEKPVPENNGHVPKEKTIATAE
ncbi:MAG TPA: ATP-dependent zinc metalloprotease FtsH, partial [bacterium]|nr:ATP-dependent zinc metalloprotease FtsH [bacterium]